jgi:hypothetical protein
MIFFTLKNIFKNILHIKYFKIGKIWLIPVLLILSITIISCYQGNLWDNKYLKIPTPGTSINFSGITATTVTVNWGAAIDNSKAQSGLNYKLVMASNASTIDTVSDANAITVPDLIMDWSLNTLTFIVAGLTDSTSYYFAVVVKDGEGNSALYSPQMVTTLDLTAPTPGTPISFIAITDTTLTVLWGLANDNLTPQSALSYKLIRGTSASAIDTVAEADAVTGPDIVMDWSVNIGGDALNGLTHGTNYFFTVLVRDGSGNEAIYSPQSVQTQFPAAWAQTVTSPIAGYSNTSYINSVTTDISGNIYTAGAICGDGVIGHDAPSYVYTYNFGNGVTADSYFRYDNVLLVKYNSAGQAQWAKTVNPGPDTSYFSSVAVDNVSGSVYAAGNINYIVTYDFDNGVTAAGTYSAGNCIVLVKYDSSGNAQWAKTAPGSPANSAVFNTIAVESSGNFIYAAGRINSNSSVYSFGSKTATGKYTNQNIVLVKYDTAGNAQWAESVYTATDNSTFYSLTLDSSNNVYAVGYTGVGAYTFNSGGTVSIANNSNRYPGATGTIDGNALIVKYDSNGNALWARTVSGTSLGKSLFNYVTVDNSGNLYAVGYIYGTGVFNFGGTGNITSNVNRNANANALLVKYDSNGNALWAQTVSGTGLGQSLLKCVSVDNSGNIFAAGSIYGTVGPYNFGGSGIINPDPNRNGSENVLLLKYDSSGNAILAKTVTNTITLGQSQYNSISVDNTGNVYAGGYIWGTGAFDFSGTGIIPIDSNRFTGYNFVLVKY